MDDERLLAGLNDQFIEACRHGSWKLLAPVLSPSFRYIDGTTGHVWATTRYIEDLRTNPAPDLAIDQLVVHVDGDAAVVSACSTSHASCNRYLDSYQRRDGKWLCFSASVWPLPRTSPPAPDTESLLEGS